MIDRGHIEKSYDAYILKFFDDSGQVDENYENNEGYLTVDRPDDHIDELRGMIHWQLSLP